MDNGGTLHFVLIALTGVVINSGVVTSENAGMFFVEWGSILTAVVLAATSGYIPLGGAGLADLCNRAFDNRSRILANCVILLLLGQQWHSWAGVGGGTKQDGVHGYSLPAFTIFGVIVLCKYAERVYDFIDDIREDVNRPQRAWRRWRDPLLTVGSSALNIASILVTGGIASLVLGVSTTVVATLKDLLGQRRDNANAAEAFASVMKSALKRQIGWVLSPLALPAFLIVVAVTICDWPVQTSAGMLHLMTAFKVALCLVHVWYAAPDENPAPANALWWFPATLTVGGWLAFLWTEFKLADKQVYTMGGVVTAAIATALAVTTPRQAKRLQVIFYAFNLGVLVCMLGVPVNYAMNAENAWSLVKGVRGLLHGKGWDFIFNGKLFERAAAAFRNASTSC
eukprot:g14310.t1